MALACLGLSACAWSAPPSSEDALVGPVRLTPPAQEEVRAQLYLLEQGWWVMREEEPLAPGARLTPGQLVVATDPDGPTHLFTVALSREWGALLQRLDRGPIDTEAPLEIVARPLEGEDGPLAPALGGCLGQRDPAESDCLEQAPPGTRWDLYARAPGSGALRVRPPEESQRRSPAPRVGVAHRTLEGVEVHAAGPTPAAWLAVARRELAPPPPRPILAAAPACAPELEAWAGERATILRAPLDEPPVDDLPTGISARALALGADAWITCEGDRVEVAAATLGRPWLRSASGEPAGPALLGAAPLALRLEDRGALGPLVLGFGLVAQGEADLAALYLTSATQAARGEMSARLGLGAAQLAALGRPGAGLRLAWASTRGSWNRRETPGWGLTRIAVMASLGRERERLVAEEELIELAQRRREEPLLGWLIWRGLALEEIVGRGRAADEIDALAEVFVEAELPEDHARRWRLALHLLHALGRPPEARPDRPDGLAGSLGLGELWEAARGRAAPLDCPAEAPRCPVDVYGRRLPAALARAGGAPAVLLEPLARTARASLRPGFSSHTLDPSAGSTPLGALALAQFTRPSRAQVLALFSRTGGALAAGPGGPLCEESARTAAIGEGFAARLDRGGDRERALTWLMARGILAGCQGVGVLVQALPRAEALTDPILALLAGWARAQQEPAARFALLEVHSELAAEHAAGSSCRRAHLALALAELASGRFERAARSATRASNCPEDGRGEGTEQTSLVHALIHVEQYGRLPGSMHEVAARALARSRRAIEETPCPGLAQQRTSQALREALDPELSELVGPARLEPNEDELRLMGAAESAQLAHESLDRARQALRRGDRAEMAAALLAAQQAAATANDDPLERKLYLVAEVFFDGDPAAALEAAEAAAPGEDEEEERAPEGEDDEEVAALEPEADLEALRAAARAGGASAAEALRQLERRAPAQPEAMRELWLGLAWMLKGPQALERAITQIGPARVPGLCEID